MDKQSHTFGNSFTFSLGRLSRSLVLVFALLSPKAGSNAAEDTLLMLKALYYAVACAPTADVLGTTLSC